MTSKIKDLQELLGEPVVFTKEDLIKGIELVKEFVNKPFCYPFKLPKEIYETASHIRSNWACASFEKREWMEELAGGSHQLKVIMWADYDNYWKTYEWKKRSIRYSPFKFDNYEAFLDYADNYNKKRW